MLKKFQVLSVFLFFFFMLPIVAGQLPFPNNKKMEMPNPDEKPVVYAASNETQDFPEVIPEVTPEVVPEVVSDVTPSMDPFDVLLVFTHSHETYKPFVEDKNGTIAVYDTKTNLFSMQKTIEDYFRLNGLNAKTLDVDVMAINQQKGLTINASYKTVRPYIKKELEQQSYDLILDIHRDSLTSDRTTVKNNDVSYAKISFVVGAENPNYKQNKANAIKLSNALNSIIPEISRGVIEKKGAGVDGVYNQDLAKEMLLIEIGGIDNTEDEVFRTIAVIAQAVSKSFAGTQLH